jgi:hypothetical protein
MGTLTQPPVKELQAALTNLISNAFVTTTGDVIAPSADHGGVGTEQLQYQLPPDLRRAGLEIWTSIRAEGCNSLRQYLKDNRNYVRDFEGLWPLAAAADFRLATLTTHEALIQALTTDDQLEIALRQISAAIFERRTGDSKASQGMRAIRTPGSGADIAPDWLVDSVSSYSRTEHRRSEQVNSEVRRRTTKGKGKGKGKGKETPP